MTEVIITSSVLIAALLVLRRLLKGRINPCLQYALWLLVALRLLIPFSIPSPTSVMNTQPAVVAQQAITQTAVEISPEFVVPQQPTQPMDTPALEPVVPRTKSEVDWLKVIWLGGCAVVGLYFAAANFAFYNKLKKQRKPLENTGCSLPVYLAEDIPSPCLFGLLQPAVYITPQAAADPQVLEHVLTHECCHYRQHDHIWSLVRILCLTIHWFNPLVWAAALCSRTDCELSCDRLVVKTIGEEQKVAYGRTLVELVQHRQKLAYLACTATTMAAKSSKTKERVTAIIKSPKTAIPILVAVLVCVALLIGFTFTGQADKQPPTEEEVIELLQKGEAVYQPGNPELLNIDRNEVMLGDLYYDEIGNYEQVVTELFTDNGIKQIEKTYCLNNKLFQMQDGKVYRAASMTDSTATVFYGDISSVKLIEQQENRFTYEIIHTSQPRWGEGEELTSRLVLLRVNGKLLIESFDYPLSNRLEKFDMLWERNADLVGWVEIPDTQLSYPVVQAEDNSYYERRDFDGNPDTYGTPFADYRIDPYSNNTVIFGNNMNDGRMFAELLNYKQLAYYKQHPTFRYDSLFREETYKIIGVFLISENDEVFLYRDMINMSEQEMAQYLEQVRSRSLIETNVDVNTTDRLVTLSTRDYSFQDEKGDRTASLVVVGRAQRSGESSIVDTSSALLCAAPVMDEKWREQIQREQAANQPDEVDVYNAALQQNYQKLLQNKDMVLEAINEKLRSHQLGTFEPLENHHPDWPEDFPDPQWVTSPIKETDYVLYMVPFERIDESTYQGGIFDIWVKLQEGYWMVLEPVWFHTDGLSEPVFGFGESGFYQGEPPFDFDALQAAQVGVPTAALQQGIVYALGDEISSFPMQRTEGRQPELDRWSAFIHSNEISRIDARTMSEARGTISPQNAQLILQILQNAQLSVMQDMGNPHTGGSMELIAYNANGNELFHCIYDQYWFSVQFMEEDEAYVFDGSVVGWDQLEALLDVGQPLDHINAELTVDRILESLILNADGNISFVIPDQLPVPNSDTDLYATLNLTYKLRDGSYRVDSLLDWTAGWQPGQVYSARWQPASGEELTGVMLRMAYMTDLGGGQYQEFHADYVELTEPLPIGRYATEQGIELKTDGRNAQIAYTGSNGQVTRLTMTLPQGVTLENSTPTFPMLRVRQNGEEIGSLSLQQYGTTDRQALLSVNTAATTPPMQIYSPIALSNHVDYSSGYRVVDSTSNASRAVCRMRYQDISNYGGNTPNAPWLEQDVILSFDLEDNPLFLRVNLHPDKLTANELEKWALGINFDS